LESASIRGTFSHNFCIFKMPTAKPQDDWCIVSKWAAGPPVPPQPPLVRAPTLLHPDWVEVVAASTCLDSPPATQ